MSHLEVFAISDDGRESAVDASELRLVFPNGAEVLVSTEVGVDGSVSLLIPSSPEIDGAPQTFGVFTIRPAASNWFYLAAETRDWPESAAATPPGSDRQP